MSVVASLRPQVLAEVATLRVEHLKGVRELSAKSTDAYAGHAKRVKASGGDPRTLAGTAASFRALRAACLWQAREQLRELLNAADRARKDAVKQGKAAWLQDSAALSVYANGTNASGGCNLDELRERLAFLTPLKFDPAMAGTHTKPHRSHQQRSKLGRLPEDWVLRMHVRTRGGKYGHAVAVGALIPVRPDEVASRVHVWIERSDEGREALCFEVKGSKVKNDTRVPRKASDGSLYFVNGGPAGQPARTVRLVRVDSQRQAVFDWLLAEVRGNDGQMTVGKGLTAGGISSAFRAASGREFPALKSPPSFYAMRHATAAEVKAAEGADAALVAMAMGHASERTQSVYGMRSQASGGYVIEAVATRPPRPRTLTRTPPEPRTKAAKAKGAPRGSPRPKGR